jgi:hypothetical protein
MTTLLQPPQAKPGPRTAAARLHQAETAFREALQTHGDLWIAAAYQRLLAAIREFEEALSATVPPAHS